METKTDMELALQWSSGTKRHGAIAALMAMLSEDVPV